MFFLYNLLIVVIEFFLAGIAIFNKKLKLFVNGRRIVYEQIENSISSSDKSIWIHCASLGEFEQGRPIIEKLKVNYPSYKIVLTFFSPSGFEVQKNYKGADVVSYLPLDTKRNAKKFIELVRPELAIFVKYEFWPNILRILKEKNIETILVSGIFRKEQSFFKPYGSWMRKSLQPFSHFFVQDENSKKLLESINLKNVSLSGDTRFDRVNEITNQDNSLDFIEQFKGTDLLFVAGSTWKEGEVLLTEYINNSNLKNVKFIIAPHNVNTKEIEHLQSQITVKSVLFSEKEKNNLEESKVFIVNTIGILTKIYSYADVAYVGGGFETGLHNVLEPATFGIPVIIGPQYDKFKEAKDLVNLGGVQVVLDQIDLKNKLDGFFTNEDDRFTTGKICSTYIQNNIGATEIVLEYIGSKIG